MKHIRMFLAVVKSLTESTDVMVLTSDTLTRIRGRRGSHPETTWEDATGNDGARVAISNSKYWLVMAPSYLGGEAIPTEIISPLLHSVERHGAIGIRSAWGDGAVAQWSILNWGIQERACLQEEEYGLRMPTPEPAEDMSQFAAVYSGASE